MSISFIEKLQKSPNVTMLPTPPFLRIFSYVKIKKSKFHYTRLIPFRVSRVSGAQLRGFAPRSTHQGCSGDESLATCGEFDRLGIWTPYLPHQRLVQIMLYMWRNLAISMTFTKHR